MPLSHENNTLSWKGQCKKNKMSNKRYVKTGRTGRHLNIVVVQKYM